MVAGVYLLSCELGVEDSERSEGVLCGEGEQLVDVDHCFGF